MTFDAPAAEPTLADVFRSIRQGWTRLAAGAVLGVLAAMVFLQFCVPHYRISMLIGPADRAPKADVKALLPDNPSFALQYLVNTMGSADSTEFTRFETMLTAPSVAAKLVNDPRIITGLRHTGLYRFSKEPALQTPEEIAELLDKEIVIEPVRDTPLRRITIDHPSPEFGIYLLTRLHDEADKILRNEVADHARSRAAYLNDLLGKVSNPDHRRALTALLMEQEHIQMVMSIDEPYAAIVAEPPSVSVKPAWPRKNVIVMGFAFAGMAIGFALWTIRHPVAARR